MSAVMAQLPTTTTVTGVVTDMQSREPLVGVTILDKANPAVGTVTDVDGHYSITLNVQKPVQLVFSYVGYDPETFVVTAVTNKLNVTLLPHNELLDDVVVTAGRFEQRQTDVTVSMEVVKPRRTAPMTPTF